MVGQYQNFAFSGGGVLGIAYIGMLDYLYKIGLMQNIQRVAGSSAGAITACIAAFNLPFTQTKEIADSLEYDKIASKGEKNTLPHLAGLAGIEPDSLFDNVECVYRMVKNYGWYSSDYLYEWIGQRIAEQFDPSKKQPPYTFLDFSDAALHKGNRPFKGLYITGTNVSSKTTSIFCTQYTPYMEVAEAVRISMSVPLLFESIKSSCGLNNEPKIYADGGLMYNYPITLFDKVMPPFQTIGAILQSSSPPLQVNNLPDFIINLLSCSTAIQRQLYSDSPQDQSRSIQIDTGDVAAMNFNVQTGDPVYMFLYKQGYLAAEKYFTTLKE